MFEPVLEELLTRARRLAVARGKLVGGAKFGELLFGNHSLCVSIRQDNDDVLVSLRTGPNKWVWVHCPDPTNWRDSTYRTDLYQEIVDIMRAMMVLEDLAGV